MAVKSDSAPSEMRQVSAWDSASYLRKWRSILSLTVYECLLRNVSLCLLVFSADDNLCKQFGSRSGPMLCRA